MKIFFSLYGKELKGMRTVFLLVVIAIICIDGFMISKTKAWGYENVFILTIVSSLFIFFLFRILYILIGTVAQLVRAPL